MEHIRKLLGILRQARNDGDLDISLEGLELGLIEDHERRERKEKAWQILRRIIEGNPDVEIYYFKNDNKFTKTNGRQFLSIGGKILSDKLNLLNESSRIYIAESLLEDSSGRIVNTAGTTGTLYKGTFFYDWKYHPDIVIKLPEQRYNTLHQEALIAEGDSLRRILNITTIEYVERFLHLDITGDYPILVTDYIYGSNLEDTLENILDLDVVNDFHQQQLFKLLACELLIGLQQLHAEEICLGEIKPSNIMITISRNAGTVVRLKPTYIDIGEFKTTDKDEIFGALRYLAPEIILEGMPETLEDQIQANIFSIGLVIFEIFTGKPFFKGKNIKELAKELLLLQKSEEEYPILEIIQQLDIPDVEKSLLGKLLRLDKNDRELPEDPLSLFNLLNTEA